MIYAYDKRLEKIDHDLGPIGLQFTTNSDPIKGLELLESTTYDYLELICEVGSTNIIPSNKKPRLDAECRQLRAMKKESRKEWKRVCDSIDI